MLLPAAWALAAGTPDFPAFLGTGLGAGLTGWGLRRWGRSSHSGGAEALHPREALATVGLVGWWPPWWPRCLGLVGELPLLHRRLLEATSGLTTTGATVLTTIEAHPPGVLFWRGLLHWLGGMGIIVLAIAILPRLEVGGLQLLRAEASDTANERLRPRLRDAARLVWSIYVGLTALAALLLWARGLSLFDALVHAFGTIATASSPATRPASRPSRIQWWS